MKLNLKECFEQFIQSLFMLLGVIALTAAYVVYSVFVLLYSLYQKLSGED